MLCYNMTYNTTYFTQSTKASRIILNILLYISVL